VSSWTAYCTLKFGNSNCGVTFNNNLLLALPEFFFGKINIYYGHIFTSHLIHFKPVFEILEKSKDSGAGGHFIAKYFKYIKISTRLLFNGRKREDH
jgi:hypothetical protein